MRLTNTLLQCTYSFSFSNLKNASYTLVELVDRMCWEHHHPDAQWLTATQSTQFVQHHWSVLTVIVSCCKSSSVCLKRPFDKVFSPKAKSYINDLKTLSSCKHAAWPNKVLQSETCEKSACLHPLTSPQNVKYRILHLLLHCFFGFALGHKAKRCDNDLISGTDIYLSQ